MHASKPFVTVSYVEPTTNTNGGILTNLAKSAIYHDWGKELVKFRDFPTKARGKVQGRISFAVRGRGGSIQATICVIIPTHIWQSG